MKFIAKFLEISLEFCEGFFAILKFLVPNVHGYFESFYLIYAIQTLENVYEKQMEFN